MSALLSPSKPVRTRFKVPGEGAYELQTNLSPPPLRVYTNPSSSQTQQAQPSKPATPPFSGGSLGLPRVTTLSFAPNTALRLETPPSPPPPRPPSPSTAVPSAPFLRKLAFTISKFPASVTDDEPPPSATNSSGARSATPPTTQISLASTSNYAESDEFAPRVPPRVATSDPSSIRGDGAFSDSFTGVLAFNNSEALMFLDLASRTTSELPLAISSKTVPTCHALAFREVLRLVVGCANGEVGYFADVLASVVAADAKRNRAANTNYVAASVASVVASSSNSAPAPTIYNRDGALNSSRVVCVRWIPGSSSSLRFVSVHVDGGILVHDARQKPTTASTLRPNPSVPGSGAVGVEDGSGARSGDAKCASTVGDVSSSVSSGDRGSERERSGLSSTSGGEKSTASGAGTLAPSHRRTGSSVLAAAAAATAAANAAAIGEHEVSISRYSKGKRGNHATVWQVGRATLTACGFSPTKSSENVLMATTGRDGYLRIIDLQKEVPVMAFRSYFGAFLCLSWSPDGKYIATGGEDDLVSIWSPSEECLVARLEGHTSWVSSVAWDSVLCQVGTYRLGSVGQDAKLLLWDFSRDMLHRRSSHRTGSGIIKLQSYRRQSGGSASGSGNGSTVSNGVQNGSGLSSVWRTGKLSRLRGGTGGGGTASNGGTNTDSGVNTEGGDGNRALKLTPVIIAAASRAEVPIVEPVVSHVAHGEPLTDLWFDDAGIFTADAVGYVKLWRRPPQHSVPELSLGRGRVFTSHGLSQSGLGEPNDLD